jgi:hypothetical protein
MASRQGTPPTVRANPRGSSLQLRTALLIMGRRGRGPKHNIAAPRWPSVGIGPSPGRANLHRTCTLMTYLAASTLRRSNPDGEPQWAPSSILPADVVLLIAPNPPIYVSGCLPLNTPSRPRSCHCPVLSLA